MLQKIWMVMKRMAQKLVAAFRKLWKVLPFSRSYKVLALLVLLLIVVVGTVMVMRKLSGSSILPEVKVVHNEKIDSTAVYLQSIREIGQWEFLSVDVEEMVDTTISQTLGSDDRIACIYKGTVHLGYDLSEISNSALVVHGDSVSLLLPKIKILDSDFIDEAHTQVVYQSGAFAPIVMESLYKRAQWKMRQRCVTAENYKRVAQYASEQFSSMFRAFGFKYVKVLQS